MLYDLNTILGRENFKVRCNQLYTKSKGKRVVVELTEKQTQTTNQNKYLHVIIRYLALQLGYSEKFAKDSFFKYEANKDTFFLGWETSPLTMSKQPKLRHSSDLSEEEMSLCIDRFITWSAQVAGVALPRPEEKAFVTECAIEVEKNKRFL